MPSRPPKKPGGKEADEADTTTNISWVTASTSKNKDQTNMNRLENWKVPNIVQMEKARIETITDRLKNEKMTHVLIGKIKEDLEPWDDFMGADFNLPYKQIHFHFMAGKELTDMYVYGDCRVLDAYMKSRGYPRTLTDQDYVPRKRNIAKPAMIWKVILDMNKEYM